MTPRKAAAPAKKAAKKTTKKAAKKSPARAAKKAATPRKAPAKKASKRARKAGPAAPIKSAQVEDDRGDDGAAGPADDGDNAVGSALRSLIESAGNLPTNSVAVDAAIDELELADDDPKTALAVLARRLARMLDIDSSNAALVREYRQTLIALLPTEGGADDGPSALEQLRRTLAGGD